MANAQRKYQSTLIPDEKCLCELNTLKPMGMTLNTLDPVKLYFCTRHNKVRRVALTDQEYLRHTAGAKISSARPSSDDGSAKAPAESMTR